jgi:hypothetical protein
MTSAILEFLILARVAGFGLVVYGMWLGVPRRYRSVLQSNRVALQK